MRRIVISILMVTLLANAALAAYLWLGAGGEPVNTLDNAGPFATRLEFHQPAQSSSESSKDDALREEASTTPSVRAIEEPAPVVAQCLYWGPFDDESAARRQVDALLAAEVLEDPDEGVLRSERIQRSPDFLIHLGPYPNRQAARSVRQELLAKDTDASVITRDDKILVSVGVFSQKRFAEAQLRKVKAMGYQPRQAELIRTQRVYFVTADIDPISIDEVGVSRPELRPVDLCSSIASR